MARVNGGFALALTPAEINMLDIVEAIEGPLSLTDCTPSPTGCAWAMDCPASTVWLAVQDSMKDTLRSSTLEDLVSTPRRNGRVSNAAPPLETGNVSAAQAGFRRQ